MPTSPIAVFSASSRAPACASPCWPLVALAAARMHHRKRLRHLVAEIERAQRRHEAAGRGLALPLQPFLAARVLEDAEADLLMVGAAVDDQRGPAAEPERALGMVVLVDVLELALIDHDDDVVAERPVGRHPPRRPHIMDLERGPARPRLFEDTAALAVFRHVRSQAEQAVDVLVAASCGRE